ncbi:MAG: class I SAM-dependent methyltransferase [Xanthobacteraceae bacterium]|nr:class I SAM-dependent methyltransferase [Xanthobacteraceae bacterium]
MMHRLHATAEAARKAARGTLDLLRCHSCGLVWNAAFDPERLRYDASYENSQAHSPAFLDHMRARADAILKAIPRGEDLDCLEVGCGQGEFLDCVVERAGGRLRHAEGFDPAFRRQPGKTSTYEIHKAQFDGHTAGLLVNPPNVVVTRHTIEHVADPVGFLASIREALGPRSRALMCVETPDVDWILENNAVHDFFYEHCCIFTSAALAIALQRAGFEGAAVDRVFGRQYLWATARAGAGRERPLPAAAARPVAHTDLKNGFVQFWTEQVRAARERGPVALWGAGAKGGTFALLVDAAGELIDHAIDINPGKQGHYLPGSGLPVVSPGASATRRPATVFVMNPVYLDEIGKVASAAGIQADLIPVN